MSSTVSAPPSPYKGLAPFEDSELDALFFFGRERESDVIAANLIATRVTVLYGPSGVGKSSVLRAGVAHRLRQEQGVEVVIFSTWTGDPVHALIETVGGAGSSLVAALEEAATQARGDLYLILDQFEECFLYHRGGGEFAAQLSDVIRRPDLRVNVLLGIREDSLARLDALKASIPNLLTNRLRLERLDRAAGAAAIVRPLTRYNELVSPEEGVEIDVALEEAILEEVTAGRVEFGVAGRGVAIGSADENQIEAPYLQLVMQTLWDAERERSSRSLRLETFRRLGGAARIVHDHLEQAMAELTPEEKQAAAAMYNHLVTPSGTKIAHRVGDLAGYASMPESQAAGVLEKLARERIVRASSANGPASARYEIFHDVLADAVLAWRARHEEQRALHEAERRRRRTLIVAIAAIAGLILVAAIAVYALVERGNSRSQARRAHAEELAAEALTGLGIDPPSSLRMAYEAALLRPGAREEGVLRSALMADRLRGILRTGGPVTAIGYGSSGRSVVVASRDGKARIYRQGSLRPLHVLGLDTPITAADISADGRHVAIGAEDGGVRAWMPNLSHQVEMRPEGRGRVRSVALANRDSWIVAGFDEAIRVWRRQGTPLASIALHNGKPLVKAVVPDNGRRVIALARSSAAWVYALPSGKRLFQLEHDGLIEDAAFSPGGRWILTGGYAGDAGGVRLWDARNGHLVREIVGALRHVQDVAFSADGKLLAAGAADGTARVWETRSGLQLAIMIGHTNRVTSVNFNRSGTALVSASSDGTARVWGASGGRAGRVLHVLAGHRAEVVAALFSPDGRAVITGSDDGTARLWDPGSEPPLTLLARSRQPLNSVAVRDAGQRIVVSREDGSGELRRLNGTLVRRLADASVSTRDILDRGSNVAAHVVDRSIVVTDPRTGRVLHTLRGHTGTVNSIHLSPDAKLLVSASDDHDARIWDVESGRLVQKLHGHFGPVLDARFSPDGRWVVTAGPITAGLWLVGSTAGPIFLDAPVARPLSATAFAGADGRLVVATSLDGTLRSYYCDICGDAQELIALAKRRLTAEH